MSLEFIPVETIQELAHEYGYWTVFGGILLENTGLPIPGETITVVGGFLAGSGELSYWGVLVSATAGAIVGDSLGYWIGFFGGWNILTRVGRLFRLQESQLVRVRDEFSKNAAKAVFLGRFIALLRIFAGPLAGLSKMPYPQFLFYNAAGALTWASVTVTIAYFVGQFVPLTQLLSLLTQFGLVVAAILVVAIGVPIWLEHRGKSAPGQAASQD